MAEKVKLVTAEKADNNSDNEFEDEEMLRIYRIPKKSKSADSQDSNNSIHNRSSEVSAKIPLTHITFKDIPKSSQEELKYAIKHPPKYNWPLYQLPVFGKLSLRDQVKYLCSYHTKLSKNIAKQACLQLNWVPLPKVIKPSREESNSPSKYELGSEEKIENDNVDPFDALYSNKDYISRSGRISKRKFYSESDDSELKKLKVQDGDWLESVKTLSPTSTTTKGAGRGRKIFDENSDNKTISKKNSEIMNRSALFKEKEAIKPGRLVKIAEMVERKKIKDSEEDAKMDKFCKSLQNSEDFDMEYLGTEEPEKKIIVIPPLPKPRRAKKQNDPYDELELTAVKEKRPPSPISKLQCERPNGRPTVQKKQTQFLVSKASASTSTNAKKSTEIMVDCPICSRPFTESNIQGHASTCGENIVETRSRNTSMSCKKCDEVFLIDSQYEKHIKTCESNSLFN